MSNHRLSVRISAALKRQLSRFLKSTGRVESEVVRDAIADYLQKHECGPSAYDLLKEAGLIGCARGMPSDLATNPKHMEGFGRD